jgi:hypothetical protein
VLGRAAMEAALSEPLGTAGLTLPYRVVANLEQLGIGFVGADDVLVKSNVRANAEALQEIDREIAQIAQDPAGAARGYDRDHVLASVRMWRDALGVEQAVNTPAHEILVNIFPLSRVLVTIARNAPEIVSFRLEAFGNPGLTRVVLDQVESQSTILSLLEHAPTVFDSSGSWNHRCVARLLLDAFESRHLDSLRNIPCDGPQHDVATVQSEEELQKNLAALNDVLSKRTDGPRLAIEWLAHLFRQSVVREPTEVARGKPSERFHRMLFLLNAVIGQFGKEGWAEPVSIWSLFGKDPGAFPGRGQPDSELDLATWCDMIGQEDAVAAFAAAALLVRAQPPCESRIAQLIPWLAALVGRLENEPELLWLSSYPSSILLSVLAWPVSCTDDPAVWIASAWKNAQEDRLRARFYRTDNGPVVRRSHGAPDPVVEKMHYCSAIIDIGSYVLRELSTRSDRDTIASRLADLLQDMIDEFRYCFPPILVERDSRLVGALSVGAVVAGLLRDVESIASFVSRYRGDDDALVAVVANAAANGVPPKTIAAGMTTAGVDFRGLPDRWLTWKRKQSHESAALLPVIEQLKLVCGS